MDNRTEIIQNRGFRVYTGRAYWLRIPILACISVCNSLTSDADCYRGTALDLLDHQKTITRRAQRSRKHVTTPNSLLRRNPPYHAVIAQYFDPAIHFLAGQPPPGDGDQRPSCEIPWFAAGRMR